MDSVVISIGRRIRRFVIHFLTPKNVGQAPLPEFPRTRELAQKDEATLTLTNKSMSDEVGHVGK